MAQATFSIRMDENLKRDFSQFCDNVGMNMTTAFVVFAKAAVKERRFPFEIGDRPVYRETDEQLQMKLRKDARDAIAAIQAERIANGIPELSLDEINDEIGAVRRARNRTSVRP